LELAELECQQRQAGVVLPAQRIGPVDARFGGQ
jgi:hypothetical protein